MPSRHCRLDSQTGPQKVVFPSVELLQLSSILTALKTQKCSLVSFVKYSGSGCCFLLTKLKRLLQKQNVNPLVDEKYEFQFELSLLWSKAKAFTYTWILFILTDFLTAKHLQFSCFCLYRQISPHHSVISEPTNRSPILTKTLLRSYFPPGTIWFLFLFLVKLLKVKWHAYFIHLSPYLLVTLQLTTDRTTSSSTRTMYNRKTWKEDLTLLKAWLLP